MSGIIGDVGSKSGVIGTTELDYEEGSWTPAFGGGGTFSHDLQVGLYTKVGRAIHATGRITMTGSPSSSGSGNMTITGLPYSSNSTTNSNTAVLLGEVHKVDWPGAAFTAYGNITPGNAVIYLFFSEDDAARVPWAPTRVDQDDSEVHFSITYHI